MVTQPPYVPERGDFVWIDLDPQAGHEQGGRRPALVLSPSFYNGRAGLALFCPLTTRVRGYSYEVQIPDGLKVTGVVLADQVRSLDWRARSVDFICAAPDETTADVLEKALTLLRPDEDCEAT